MAGWTTAGGTNPGPPTVNGVAVVAPQGLNPQLSALAEVSCDTEGVSGSQPQTVSAFTCQVAMIAAALIHNTQTSTVHAATSNTISGQVVTEALTTAAGATYTFTLTNSLIVTTPTAGSFSQILFDIRSGTNTNQGMVPASYTTSAGSVLLTFTNTGTAAMNGTMVIAYHLAP